LPVQLRQLPTSRFPSISASSSSSKTASTKARASATWSASSRVITLRKGFNSSFSSGNGLGKGFFSLQSCQFSFGRLPTSRFLRSQPLRPGSKTASTNARAAAMASSVVQSDLFWQRSDGSFSSGNGLGKGGFFQPAVLPVQLRQLPTSRFLRSQPLRPARKRLLPRHEPQLPGRHLPG